MTYSESLDELRAALKEFRQTVLVASGLEKAVKAIGVFLSRIDYILANESKLELTPELLEKLAAIEHERWAGWMFYVFSISNPCDGEEFLIPPEFVKRWKRQIETPYKDLTEAEKESDRVEVRKYWSTIEREL